MAVAHLLIVCALMFIGPVITGSIPLGFNIAAHWLKWMELLGAGVMISSAFAVVLPEGFAALYQTQRRHRTDQDAHDNTGQDPLLIGDDLHHHDDNAVSHGLPGLALLAGFLTMLLFEFVHHGQHHSHMGKDISNKGRDQFIGCTKAPCGSHKHSHGGLSSGSDHASVLTALLVHAAADGLAVGVASMSTSIRLAVSVGFAMVLHKGPVAFGLSSFLIGQHAAAGSVFMDLLLFSVTSPIAALLSYALLRQANSSSSGTFVAMCVLFSAGTFVYAAAVHMMPDFSGKSHTISGVLVLCLGAVIPCLINLLDLHDH